MRTWAAFCACAFALLAILAGTGASRGYDRAFTIALQSSANTPFDIIANADTVIGQASVTTALAIILAFVARRREPGAVWLAPLLLAGTAAVEIVLKAVLQHPPPPAEFIRAFGGPLGNPLGVHIETPSVFPSGHVARITFLAIVTAALFPSRALTWLLWTVVALTVVARAYIGDHWITDGLGGLALGGAVGFAAAAWIEQARAASAALSPTRRPPRAS